MIAAAVNPIGGSGVREGRDGACTPRWLAELIGQVDLDPCSNPRSHINAKKELSHSVPGDDGLMGPEPGHYSDCGMPKWATETTRVFINPPYARGEVIRWVRHYRHTRFIFLLRWDPSTDWFAELWPECSHYWFADRRINFEPPPGVTFSSNPMPHGLYLREPGGWLLDRLRPHGYLLTKERR